MAAPFPIDFPKYDLKFRTEKGQREIFDFIRKTFVALTPEEMVRQHLLHYLVLERGYAKGLLAVEMGLTLNQLSKRCDIVAYQNEGKPTMIVECKAPTVKLAQNIFDQAARYNQVLMVPYLLISNGIECYCAKIDFTLGTFTFENEIPSYHQLLSTTHE
ncbi:MAG: type I restriction enzyme HsdR N-terminal domain-containing protein [Chitinophagales bacterium]|nr:type I restriction enzyme HsdR N-terminal domain-containing protein [Chitinophagales bacterium]